MVLHWYDHPLLTSPNLISFSSGYLRQILLEIDNEDINTLFIIKCISYLDIFDEDIIVVPALLNLINHSLRGFYSHQ